MKLTKNNKKVKGALLWSLPTGRTCPGKTKMCEKICYAKSTEKTYPVAKKLWIENFECSKNPKFVKNMVLLLNKSRTKYVRIHQSGDFYNQVYLDNWVQIMKDCPEKQFFAFTKSHMLDWSKAISLSNFNIRYSIDETSENFLQGVPLALTSNVKKKGFFTCPGGAGDEEPKCIKDCKVCAETDKNVRFHLHGPNKNKGKKK